MRKVLAVVLAVASLAVLPGRAPTVHAASCAPHTLDAGSLNAVFNQVGAGATPSQAGFGGGDYPHAYPLPDGRVLWLFQDLHFSNDNDLRDSTTNAAHNAGLIEAGDCFTILGGRGLDLIGDSLTQDSRRWFWPMDGEIGYDGNLWVFMVEMYNPNGTGAQAPAAPVATWLAKINPNTLNVVSFAKAPNSSPSLYGWSVVSTDQYSYLYGHCYRQFIHAPTSSAQFDSACMPHEYLARVPVGHFDAAPEYWNGSGWTTNAAAAVSVFSRGAANPMSVQWFGDVFVNVTKNDEWWGTTISVDRSPTPQGPWQTVQTINVLGDRKCQTNCGNYGAFLMPWLDASGKMTIALSNGGDFALWRANAFLYRPTFYSVPVPAMSPSGSAATPPAFTVAGSGAGFVPVDPERLVDTRKPAQQFGRLNPGAPATLDLRGRVPAGTTAVALNLTSDQTAGPGFVRAFACNQAEPSTSNLNPAVGQAVTNAAIVPIGDGRICFTASVATDLLVDLNGWLTTTSNVGLVSTSRRVADTRSGQGGSTRLSPGTSIEVPVVPSGSTAVAVALTVTAVNPWGDGYVTVWPCGVAQPTVSALNPKHGITRPNLVNVRVGTGGKVCLYSFGDTDLIVDVVGEYRPGASSRYVPVGPVRLQDSRVNGHHRHPSNLSEVVALGNVTAAQVNLTATETAGAGYLTAYPCLTSQWPGTSNSNYLPLDTVGSSALLPPSRGYGCVYSSVPAQIVVDLFGVWT